MMPLLLSLRSMDNCVSTNHTSSQFRFINLYTGFDNNKGQSFTIFFQDELLCFRKQKKLGHATGACPKLLQLNAMLLFLFYGL